MPEEVQVADLEASDSQSEASPSAYSDEVESQLDAAADKVLGISSNESSATSSNPVEASADPAPAGTTPVPAKVNPEAPGCSDDEKQLLGRFHLPVSVVPTDPAYRRAFFDGLKQRHDDGNRMHRESEQLKQQLAQLQQQLQQIQQPKTPQAKAEADYLAKLAEFDPEIANSVQGFTDGALARSLTPMQERFETARQESEQLWSALGEMHQEQGFSDVTAKYPDIIDLNPNTPTGKANREKLLNNALPLLRANWNPTSFNYRHALAKAASETFSQEIQLAERSRIAESQRRARRGQPNPGGLPSRTKPPLNNEEREDKVLEGIFDEGISDPRKLEAIALGRG